MTFVDFSGFIFTGSTCEGGRVGAVKGQLQEGWGGGGGNVLSKPKLTCKIKGISIFYLF